MDKKESGRIIRLKSESCSSPFHPAVVAARLSHVIICDAGQPLFLPPLHSHSTPTRYARTRTRMANH
jgi:hypothetical protein